MEKPVQILKLIAHIVIQERISRKIIERNESVVSCSGSKYQHKAIQIRMGKAELI